MNKFNNPVIPGMAPDPSIIRVNDDYYMATSTFHWTPPIHIYHSKNLSNWELISYGLTNGEVDLRGANTPAGIWAPHLSYDKETEKFWLSYSHMVNMAGREFNADTYAIWTKDITGPWSEPIYLSSIGFDSAIFHDDDGKKYVTILEWETRTGHQSPGTMVIAEYDIETGTRLTDWHRVTKGFTTRGNAEAPQIYKRNGYYYLIIAAGGTGYGHGVEIGRSKSIFGPYEPHPSGEPILTSNPQTLFSLGDPDAGHFEMYNPNSIMQKSGHGSLVETQHGEWYMPHLMSRPLEGQLLNPLGRETSIQKMRWTDDDWLEMADGSNFAKMEVDKPEGLEEQKKASFDISDDFSEGYSLEFMTPYRTQSSDWVNAAERPGYLRIYGGNSLFSKVNPAIMATRATSFKYEVETRLSFVSDHYSERAGLGLYYDSNNWFFVNLNYDERTKENYLTILQAKLGKRIEYTYHKVENVGENIDLKLKYDHGFVDAFYRIDGDWEQLILEVDVTYLADEGVNGEEGEIGGFTGLFNFLGVIDAHQHDSYADFEYYKVVNG